MSEGGQRRDGKSNKQTTTTSSWQRACGRGWDEQRLVLLGLPPLALVEGGGGIDWVGQRFAGV